MPIRSREMSPPMYWSVICLGIVALVFAVASTVDLVRRGWDLQLGLVTLSLYAAAIDFLYAAFGPPGRWPALFWFWQ